MNLLIGNTEVIAKMVKDVTSGDLFRIDIIKPYPEDYGETTELQGKNYAATQDLHF